MAGTIKHRHQTAIADSGADVDASQWNDSEVISGGSDKQLVVRDTGAGDGWSLQDAKDSILRRGTRSGQPAANAVNPGTKYVVTDEGYVEEQSDGSSWLPGSPAVGKGYIFQNGLTFQNTATTIAAVTDVIAHNSSWRVEVFGDYFNNTGANRTLSIVLTIGSKTITLSAAASVAAVTTSPIFVNGFLYFTSAGHLRLMLLGRLGPATTAGTAATDSAYRHVWDFDDGSDYAGTQTITLAIKVDSSGTTNFFSGGARIYPCQ